MPNEPDDADATGADPKERKERIKRGQQLVPKPGSDRMNVTQLAHRWGAAWGGFNRAHPPRNNYYYEYGLRACEYDEEGKPTHWYIKDIDQAIERRDAKAAGIKQTDATGQDAPSSDLPFRYQPGSAVRAGLPVAKGFEDISLDAYERSIEETKRIRRGEIEDF